MALTKIPASFLDKSAHVDFADNEQLRFGDSNDLKMYHNSSGPYNILQSFTSNELRIEANGNIKLMTNNGDDMVVCNKNGAVEIYHDDEKKIETTSTGASVTGNLAVSGNLTVSGTTTELDTTNLNVTDKNITLNYHASSDTSSNADGAGITIQDAVNASTNATLNWSAANDRFVMSHGLQVTSGNVGIGTTVAPMGTGLTVNSGISSSSTTAIEIQQNTNGANKAAAAFGVAIDNGGESTNAADLYFSTATGGALVKRMTIRSSGKVGIGTTSPATELQIGDYTDNAETLTFATASDQTGRINFYNANASEGASIRVTGGGHGAKMYFANRYNTDADRVTFDLVNGRVGIGETGPAYPLHVDGTNVLSGGGLANLCLVDRTAYNGTLPGAGITFRGEYTSGGNTTNFATIQGIKENTSSGNYATALRFTTRANGGNLTERMRIDSSGNVGIGTISADLKLDVSHDTAAQYIATFQNTANNNQLKIGNQAQGYLNIQGARIDNGNAYNFSLQADGGNVGIGTTIPNAPLEVNGGTGMTGGWGRSLLLRHAFPTLVWQSEYSTDAYAGIGYDNTTGMHFMVNSPTIDVFANSQTSAMTILDNKNIGIGTSSPSTTLHVTSPAGSNKSAIITRSSGAEAVNLSEMQDYNALQILNKASGSYLNFAGNASNTQIQAQSNGSTAENISLNPYGGQVSIGTNTTGAKLYISGKDDAGASDLLALQFDNSPGDTGITFRDIFDGVQCRFTMDSGNTNNLRISSGTLIDFYTNTSNGTSSPRMRIGNTGDIRFGSSGAFIATDECFTFANQQRGRTIAIATQGNSSFYGIDMWNQVGGSCNQVLFRGGASGATTGTITSTGNNATQYNTSSDYRLKENVDYTWDATTRLKQLKPVRFNWIDDDTNTLEDGFLAHEVSSIVPNAVTGEKDAVYTEEEAATEIHIDAGDIKRQQLDHSKLVPLLVKTIQELEARIATLEG